MFHCWTMDPYVDVHTGFQNGGFLQGISDLRHPVICLLVGNRIVGFRIATPMQSYIFNSEF